MGGATRGSVRVRNVRLNTSRRPRDVLTNGVGSGFGKWMQETHDGAFTSAFKRVRTGSGGANANGGNAGAGSSYDHVYIDVNNVLHVAAHHTKNEEAFFKKLFALLDLNLRKTRPQYTVTLALDGGVGQTLLQFLVLLQSTLQVITASMGHVTNLTPPGVSNPRRPYGKQHRLIQPVWSM